MVYIYKHVYVYIYIHTYMYMICQNLVLSNPMVYDHVHINIVILAFWGIPQFETNPHELVWDIRMISGRCMKCNELETSGNYLWSQQGLF